MDAKVYIQGAHPWMVRSSFFLTSMLQVQKRVPVGGPGFQGQIPPFQLNRWRRDKSGQEGEGEPWKWLSMFEKRFMGGI